MRRTPPEGVTMIDRAYQLEMAINKEVQELIATGISAAKIVDTLVNEKHYSRECALYIVEDVIQEMLGKD